MSEAQDRILQVIEDPGAAKILDEIWRQIEGEPVQAARLLRAFQGVKAVLKETMEELPAQWEALEQHLTRADLERARVTQDLRDFRASTVKEMAAAVEDLKVMQAFFRDLNEDAFLNKANRLMDLCEKLARAKRDGTLDILKKLL